MSLNHDDRFAFRKFPLVALQVRQTIPAIGVVDTRNAANEFTCEFRLDVYHRINAFEIHLPPLRERRDDVLPALFYVDRLYEENDWLGRSLLTAEGDDNDGKDGR